MQTAYLLIGGNLGNRLKNLKQAVELIEAGAGKIKELSSVYETAAWGKTDQPSFLNQVVVLQTSMPAPDLMTALLAIEEKMGRKRLDRYGPRIIDIDILLYGREVHQSGHLKVPHPELQNRRFALVPLAELAGDLVHPVLHKSISNLLEDCKDELAVKKVSL
ncbi:2-amino-4-hydroxy-6-hydroxymethyldihydropteridine diphosphokinase [Flavihumibacter stibioxidans]|uniref:2-amino-4-hydroxy-6-hydroxymethyldihydropteridine pyrophosphokinase n=1 Tax=Flavihumibacter stibioxidans TaxID=1834163 RepID=A0ABR7MDR2_9BACT|nr:2-amino-4-hydroxy-6-hydroxymethyldihydropteridine diphosphokinase [Flavihumibacter stibioxidans]MBC6493082.1 2-amino-4-hydroxy-6-hydroxymethyldihydropteridine diphosphokinase [Flavihumibacter stibioxidans]